MCRRLLLSLCCLILLPATAFAAILPGFEPVWEKGGRGSLPSPSGRGAGDEGFTDLNTGMEFVFVKGGCFQMGSQASEKDRGSDEGPQHEVCVDDFYLGKFEVTNVQYRKFKSGYDSGNYEGKTLNGDEQPVVRVSWDDAVAYAQWLSGKSGKGVRLPTEAEWEYAARAGSKTARWWGDDPDQACRNANVHDQTSKRVNTSFTWAHHNCDDGYAVTAPVGKFAPNGFGFYDMLGNVWEWTGDWYGDTYYAQSPRNNPQGPSGGSGRVDRGGGWDDGPGDVRSAVRDGGAPDGRYNDLGFRLAFPAR